LEGQIPDQFAEVLDDQKHACCMLEQAHAQQISLGINEDFFFCSLMAKRGLA
jgi:hypothetical protein